jgi:alkyldihydroxyacetonephosphate synthase
MLRTGSIHDSLETSVTWDKCNSCLVNMRKCFQSELAARKIRGVFSHRSVVLRINVGLNNIHVSFIRISQVYHEGCCIYFYFGLNECENQRESFLEIYALLKDTLVRSGASLSHHHGIGKRGQEKFSQYLPSTSRSILRAVKKDVDPKNVFGAGNLIFNESSESTIAKL